MARKSDFKTVETDLDELEEKIRKHRRKIAKRIIIVVAAVVALFLIVWLWMALRTYKSFDVKKQRGAEGQECGVVRGFLRSGSGVQQ